VLFFFYQVNSPQAILIIELRGNNSIVFICTFLQLVLNQKPLRKLRALCGLILADKISPIHLTYTTQIIHPSLSLSLSPTHNNYHNSHVHNPYTHTWHNHSHINITTSFHHKTPTHQIQHLSLVQSPSTNVLQQPVFPVPHFTGFLTCSQLKRFLCLIFFLMAVS